MKIQTVGKLLIALGVLIIFHAWNMPVSNGYSGVINLHLINRQQNTLIFGGLLFISGIVLFAAFKIKQTKEEEKFDSEASEAIKQKTAEKFANGRDLLKEYLDRIMDAQGEHVDSLRDHPIARVLTGLYVGFCWSLIISSFFEYGFLIGFPISIWLAFRPRVAYLVISRVNIANVVLLTPVVSALYIQDLVDVFAYNANAILGLLFLIFVSAVLWVYTIKRLKPRN